MTDYDALLDATSELLGFAAMQMGLDPVEIRASSQHHQIRESALRPL